MVDIRVIPPRALRSLTGMHRVPDITLEVGETHDMSQYVGDGVVIDTSQILNLNPAVATYDNATKLLTGVTAGLLSGLQYEVTTVVAALLHGDPLSITGDSYGARRGDLQEIFEKFDGGTLEGAWTDTGGLVPTTTKPRHIRQTYSAESDFKIANYAAFRGGTNDTKWFCQYWYSLKEDTWTWGLQDFPADPGSFCANMKHIRWWYSGSDPGNVVGSIHSYSSRYYITNEGLGGPADVNVHTQWGYDSVGSSTLRTKEPPNPDPGDWRLHQYEFIDSSAQDVADAEFRWWINGSLVNEQTGFISRNATNPNVKRPFILGLFNSWRPASSPTGENIAYLDDAYISNSFCRVELGDNITYGSCTQRELQTVTSWSDSEVAITINQGSFLTLSGLHIHVTKEDGSRIYGGTL